MERIKKLIRNYPDYPKKGILFMDVLPILRHPKEFNELISLMGESEIINKSDAIIAIDSRGFIFGSALSLLKSKPMVVARKPGKLPGELLSQTYDLEYGKSSLSIQKESVKDYKTFVIIDDLLATGGTAMCVYKMLKSLNKEILGLSVVIELKDLNSRKKMPFSINSQIQY